MKTTTDIIFRIGLLAKGVDSVFEVVGGILITMPTKLARYLLVLSQHELYRHHEVMSGRLDRLAETVQVHAHLGAALYLIAHGGAKAVLIAAIVRGKRWGYTGLIAVLSVFTLIEMTRAIAAHEILTGLLGLFDIVIVVVIYKEYKARFFGAAQPPP